MTAKNTTLPKGITDHISNQRAVWKAYHDAKTGLEKLNREVEAKLCECNTDKDPNAPLEVLAKERAARHAFKAELEALAVTRRAEAGKAIVDTEDAARQYCRENHQAFNAAVESVRSLRVQRRTGIISSALQKSIVGSTDAAADITPVLSRILSDHRRNNGLHISENEVKWSGEPWSTATNTTGADFLRILAESDPSVREIDALPVLGGPNDRISEEEFEAVASFLESLPAVDIEALNQPAK